MKQYIRSASDPVKEQIKSLCSKYGFELKKYKKYDNGNGSDVYEIKCINSSRFRVRVSATPVYSYRYSEMSVGVSAECGDYAATTDLIEQIEDARYLATTIGDLVNAVFT